MFTCASCTIAACETGDKEKMPKNCPMRDNDFFDHILEEYAKPENHDFFLTSTAIEALGYCQWPRLREVAEFAHRMGYTRLGMGFCMGLHKEAAIVERILRKQGFQVVSVCCKTGGIPKREAGFTEETLSTPDHHVECTPFQKQLVEEPWELPALESLSMQSPK